MFDSGDLDRLLRRADSDRERERDKCLRRFLCVLESSGDLDRERDFNGEVERDRDGDRDRLRFVPLSDIEIIHGRILSRHIVIRAWYV